MKTYEQRQSRIEEELIKDDDWLGVRIDMRDRTRKEVLEEFARYLKSEGSSESEITTDINNPDGVPEFILDLEKDVCKEEYTTVVN